MPIDYKYILEELKQVEAGYLLIDVLFTYNDFCKNIKVEEYFPYYPSDYGQEPYLIYNKIKELNAKVILDIGVLYGLSTRVCLLAARDFDAHVWSCDINQPKKGFLDFIEKFNLKKYWTFNLGNDLDFIRRFNEPIDIVLLDSNHESDHVYKQLELYYPKIRKGGSMFIHDAKHTTVYDAITIFAIKNLNWEIISYNTKLGYTEFKKVG